MSAKKQKEMLDRIKAQTSIKSDDAEVLNQFGTGTNKAEEEPVKKKVGRPKTKLEKVSNIPFVPPSAKFKHDLKLLALNENTTMQALMLEGLKRVFESRGKNFDKYVNK